MTYRVRNILIAVVLAALAALMTSYYVSNYKRHVQQGEKHVTVYVAAHDIPANTPGAEAAKMLSTKDVTKSAVAPGAIANPDDLKSYVSSQPIYAGEQVTLNRFSTVASTGVHGQLKGTLRAYVLPGDANQLLVGTLRAGDHVDLVANFKYKLGTSDTYLATRIVLRDVKVLRASAGGGAGGKFANGGLDAKYTVMLAVTDNQSQKLHFSAMNAAGQGSGNGAMGWWLELRPPVKSADSPDSVETLRTILTDGLRPAQKKLLEGNYGG
jgi:Flp pilus assembly protein CpaB